MADCKERRNVGIEMRDGTIIAGNVYLPGDVGGSWPAALSYYPYLKDGWLGPAFDSYQRYLAKCGYAAILADFRGTGASDGIKADAFENQEDEDVYDLVEGVAMQPWCDGKVAMWGVSYGGITSLRAAAARPPHLRAIASIDGSTDPYLYEVMRYGAPGLAMILDFSSLMLCLGALPPLAGVPTESAAKVWANHLDALTPWHHAWLNHPYYDEYWQGRAVDPARIEVPTLLITSWRDTNPAGVWRDFEALKGPRRIIAGPWQHGLPDEDRLDPIHSLHEIVGWFDRWLRQTESVADESQVSAYVLGRGTWEAYGSWPPETAEKTLYATGSGRLSAIAPTEATMTSVEFDATVGVQGGVGLAHPAGDQTDDDRRSVVFETPELEEELEIVGIVKIFLSLRPDVRDVDVAVRLLDLDPTGHSTLITKGFMRAVNPPPHTGESLTGHEYNIELALNPIRYHVAKRHRLGLAFATADFPEIWPTVSRGSYAVVSGGPRPSGMSLPLLTPARHVERTGRRLRLPRNQRLLDRGHR